MFNLDTENDTKSLTKNNTDDFSDNSFFENFATQNQPPKVKVKLNKTDEFSDDSFEEQIATQIPKPNFDTKSQPKKTELPQVRSSQ